MAAAVTRPLRIAHGYGNSRRHLALALEGPVDYVEADVWYQGGRVAVRHERKLGPLPFLFDEKDEGHAGHGPGRYGLSLGRWYIKLQISTRYLEDVLALAHGRRRILVDVKWSPGGRQSAFARVLAQSVRLAGMGNEVTFCGSSTRACASTTPSAFSGSSPPSATSLKTRPCGASASTRAC
jgi:hypothetical protein